ncbi:MAG: hypothetical protein JSV82_02160, partial [Planctomycetota bacterium]
ENKYPSSHWTNGESNVKYPTSLVCSNGMCTISTIVSNSISAVRTSLIPPEGTKSLSLAAAHLTHSRGMLTHLFSSLG